MRKTGLLAAAVLMALMSSPAHALIIKNLGDEPQTLIVEQLGTVQEVTIPAGGRYQRQGAGFILRKDADSPPIIVRQGSEYSIWPDGAIRIQRYQKVQIGRN